MKNYQTSSNLERKPAVLLRLGLASSTLYENIKQGLFPPGIQIGSRAVAWFEHETSLVITAMAAGKTSDEIKSLVSKLISMRQEGQP